MKNLILIIIGSLILVALIIAVDLFFKSNKKGFPIVNNVNNFEECVMAGNPVMESYPRQCRAGNQTFTEIISEDIDKTNDKDTENNGSGNTNGEDQKDNSDSGSQTGILPFDSGVSGVVSMGPICPVVQNPPDPGCADKSFATTVQVFAVGSISSAPFSSVETDKQGGYKIILPPGNYTLQAIGGNPFPSCETKDITIEPSKTITVDLSCDTGIR